jgi:MFS family permease
MTRAEAAGAAARPTGGAWAPLRHRVFRALWLAQFASNTGTWMQTVGAQWLMGDLGGGAFAVALVQTATALPIFLAVIPAGALGDIFDRRRLLIGGQTAMLAGSGALAALSVAGAVTPVRLLALVFLVGLGQAVSQPSWQAIQPELVARDEIPQAATLNGVNFNVARAVGPAIGGAIIAASGPELTFALNAASFLGVVAVLGLWRRPAVPRGLAPEHLGSALGAGLRFVRSAPSLRVVLARAGLFVAFASALWALLPVVARERLALGSGGYGLLLGSVGLGAIAGALTLPALRARLSLNGLVAAASAAYAASCLVVGLTRSLWLDVLALALTGLAWIAVLSSLNASTQTILPNWARARGMSFYQLVFQGAQALGAAVWGVVAQTAGLGPTLVVSAGGLLAGIAVGRGRALTPLDVDLRPARAWPEPELALDPAPGDGPVLVTVEYRVRADQADAFRAAMRPVERARRRTGARRWGLFQDGADPERFLEVYVLSTWEEHLRQHEERFTVRDAELEERAKALAVPGAEPRVAHLISAYGGMHDR